MSLLLLRFCRILFFCLDLPILSFSPLLLFVSFTPLLVPADASLLRPSSFFLLVLFAFSGSYYCFLFSAFSSIFHCSSIPHLLAQHTVYSLPHSILLSLPLLCRPSFSFLLESDFSSSLRSCPPLISIVYTLSPHSFFLSSFSLLSSPLCRSHSCFF